MNGSATSIATKIARIFGTNTSVISWICVSAWKSEMTTPTISPISISGLATSTSVSTASRATSRTSAPDIFLPFAHLGLSPPLIPAQAGIQKLLLILGPRFRGDERNKAQLVGYQIGIRMISS